MFVALVLENLWKIYHCSIIDYKPKKLKKIVNHLKLKNVSDRDLNVKEKENILKTVMSNWLPVPAAVLGTIVRKLPSPKTAQKSRVNIIWPTLFAIDNADRNRHGDITPQMCNLVRKAVEECDENGPRLYLLLKWLPQIRVILLASMSY